MRMTRTKAAGLLLLAGTGAAALALAAGARRWRREVGAAVQRLGSARAAIHAPAALPATPIDLAALGELPAPVMRYLGFALSPSQRRIRAAWMRWSGEIRQAAGQPWQPFQAQQHVQVEPPGLAWDASVPVAPLLDVRVLDAYAAGEGMSVARLGGLVRVAGQGGTREVAQASLMRWLAEAPWYPAALLPGERLRWEARSDDAAVATLVDGGLSVSVEFRFAQDGRILECSALRWRDVGGPTPVLTPWGGRYLDWERVDGMMIPMSAEVWWAPPEGELSVWRGRIERIAHAFA